MPLIRALINADGSGLVEGQAGAGSQTLPSGVVLEAHFAAGWTVNRDLVMAGWKIANLDTNTLGALPAGHELVSYGIADGALSRVSQPAPPPVLTRPRLKLFLKLTGMLDLYAVLAETLAASSDATEALAGFTALDGTEFTFAEVVGQAAAALAAMPEPIEGAPDLGDPAAVGALRAAWDAAATQELPS